MKKNISKFIFLLLMLSASMIAVSQMLTTSCIATKSVDAERGKPLIYGESYQVPALHIQLRAKLTDAVLTAKGVHVRYYWKWLQYPYPEHEWGGGLMRTS